VSADLLPILVAVLTIAGAAATYAYQKRVDRQNQLIDLRRASYQELLTSLQRYLDKRTDENRQEFSAARTRAFIVASDEVAVAVGKFVAASVNQIGVSRPDGEAVLRLYAEMVIAMRRDCFEQTRLMPSEVVEIAPVVWSGESRK